MAGGLDTEMGAQALYTKLSGAAGLSSLAVYDGGAPGTATYPFITFEHVPSESPKQSADGVYILGKTKYRVKVHGKEVPFSALRPYKVAIYTALHRQTLFNVTSGEVYAVICREEVKEEEEVNGITYRRLGYDVMITGRSG